MRACKSLSHEKVSMFGVCVCFFLFECVCVVFVSVCMHLPVLANNKTSLNRGIDSSYNPLVCLTRERYCIDNDIVSFLLSVLFKACLIFFFFNVIIIIIIIIIIFC